MGLLGFMGLWFRVEGLLGLRGGFQRSEASFCFTHAGLLSRNLETSDYHKETPAYTVYPYSGNLA